MLSDVWGIGVSEFSGRPIFIIVFIKENWICAMTRHHAEPNINILLTRNLHYYWQEIFILTLTSDSEAILQWCHCIAFGLNRKIEWVVNFNATWLGFVLVLISFVHLNSAVVVLYFVYIFKLCFRNKLIAKWVLAKIVNNHK